MSSVVRPCPICDGRQGDVLHHQHFAVPDGYPLPDEYDVVICNTCAMVYADTPARQAAYDTYYASWSIYSQAAGPSPSTTPAGDLPRLEQTGALFASHIPSTAARILDVGCANGGLLHVLRRLGFHNLTGIDPSPACVANTRRDGCPAYLGDLAHLPAGMGEFDAVILTSVLEHVHDVQSFVAALVSLCAPKGRIFLEVPDAAGYVDYLRVPFLDISTEHVNHFSPAAVRNLMSRFGFAPVLEKQIPVPGPCGSVSSGLEVGYERRAGQAARPWLIDSTFRTSIEDYLRQSRSMMRRIDRHLRRELRACPQVIVWGVGQLAMKLLCDTVLRDARIVAFVDGNPVHTGKTLRGVPILCPEALENTLRNKGAPIVIATLLHTQGICDRIESLGLTNRVITLEPHSADTNGLLPLPKVGPGLSPRAG